MFGEESAESAGWQFRIFAATNAGGCRSPPLRRQLSVMLPRSLACPWPGGRELAWKLRDASDRIQGLNDTVGSL